MLEKCDVVRAMFHGFDYRCGISGAPAERLVVLADAVDWVLKMQQADAAREETEEAKTKARRRFDLAVAALSKAFALAAASAEAEEIRDEVGFFQTIRVVLNKKTAAKTGKTPAQIDAAIQQIVSRAIVSTEIIDVMAAAGIESPNISILSDDFLAEIRNMDRKNLALEALRRLINDEIRAPERKNVIEIRSFSQRLEDAIKRYHNNALTTAQVIEQLIELAKEIQEARQQGEDDGLSVEERAFYAALADKRKRRGCHGQRTATHHRSGTLEPPQAKHLCRLDRTPRRPCQASGVGEADLEEIWLSARPPGRCGSNRYSAGGDVCERVGQGSGLIQEVAMR